jgi:hypothetical protein
MVIVPCPVLSTAYEDVLGCGFALVGKISSCKSRTEGEMMSTIPAVTVPSPFKLTLPSSDAVPRFPAEDVKKKAYWPWSVAFEAIPEINVLAVAILSLSVTEVAVMVITVPEAAEAGAV